MRSTLHAAVCRRSPRSPTSISIALSRAARPRSRHRPIRHIRRSFLAHKGHRDRRDHRGHKDRRDHKVRRDRRDHKVRRDRRDHKAHKDRRDHKVRRDRRDHRGRKGHRDHKAHKDRRDHRGRKGHRDRSDHVVRRVHKAREGQLARRVVTAIKVRKGRRVRQGISMPSYRRAAAQSVWSAWKVRRSGSKTLSQFQSVLAASLLRLIRFFARLSAKDRFVSPAWFLTNRPWRVRK